ncbi:MAG: hypothetical protein JKX70_08805 [Phycisphaerales bacterium]|nr:hypothetical protein [Phycisphaerales bacterium]
MNYQDNQSTFVPILQASHELGVPSAWLRREAQAGRIPAIKAGQRWLVHLEHARIKLADCADQEGGAK